MVVVIGDRIGVLCVDPQKASTVTLLELYSFKYPQINPLFNIYGLECKSLKG